MSMQYLSRNILEREQATHFGTANDSVLIHLPFACIVTRAAVCNRGTASNAGVVSVRVRAPGTATNANQEVASLTGALAANAVDDQIVTARIEAEAGDVVEFIATTAWQADKNVTVYVEFENLGGNQ